VNDVSGQRFPTTIWSDVLAARRSGPQRDEWLTLLLTRYWPPVYTYVRTAFRAQRDDAEDLTQSFFTHILEADTLERLTPERGSFRGYLKRSLKHFVIDHKRKEAVRQRAMPVVPLDPQLVGSLEPSSDETPERAFDRIWGRTVLERGIETLRERLHAQGRGRYFDVFSRYAIDAPPGVVPTYASVALELNLKESDVRNYLRHCRQRMREIIAAELRDTVHANDDIEVELRAVLAG
jgi:RNA polymerase sigma factor (sigma-70 family)